MQRTDIKQKLTTKSLSDDGFDSKNHSHETEKVDYSPRYPHLLSQMVRTGFILSREDDRKILRKKTNPFRQTPIQDKVNASVTDRAFKLRCSFYHISIFPPPLKKIQSQKSRQSLWFYLKCFLLGNQMRMPILLPAIMQNYTDFNQL